VPHAFAVESSLALIASLVLLALKGFCLVDALVRPAPAYLAADKNKREFWLLLLGLALVLHLLFWDPISLFNLGGSIAALVYLLDVRPAVRALTGPR
jgi:hypothetical protein